MIIHSFHKWTEAQRSQIAQVTSVRVGVLLPSLTTWQRGWGTSLQLREVRSLASLFLCWHGWSWGPQSLLWDLAGVEQLLSKKTSVLLVCPFPGFQHRENRLLELFWSAPLVCLSSQFLHLQISDIWDKRNRGTSHLCPLLDSNVPNLSSFFSPPLKINLCIFSIMPWVFSCT